MALSDIDSSLYCWYDDAYGNMADYASTTSEDFGAGEKNTQTMISKWNSSAYGSQNGNSQYPDLWGLSVIQSGTWNGSSGWYVPSRGEWSAFGAAFGITEDNYRDYGIFDSSWSSSQDSTRYAWFPDFYYGYMRSYYVTNYRRVRLGTTF